MISKNEGGPAFPYNSLGPYGHSQGMTLRDWFAGQAMCAAVSRSDYEPFRTAADLAEYLYEIADAMLAARDK